MQGKSLEESRFLHEKLGIRMKKRALRPTLLSRSTPLGWL